MSNALRDKKDNTSSSVPKTFLSRLTMGSGHSKLVPPSNTSALPPSAVLWNQSAIRGKNQIASEAVPKTQNTDLGLSEEEIARLVNTTKIYHNTGDSIRDLHVKGEGSYTLKSNIRMFIHRDIFTTHTSNLRAPPNNLFDFRESYLIHRNDNPKVLNRHSVASPTYKVSNSKPKEKEAVDTQYCIDARKRPVSYAEGQKFSTTKSQQEYAKESTASNEDTEEDSLMSRSPENSSASSYILSGSPPALQSSGSLTPPLSEHEQDEEDEEESWNPVLKYTMSGEAAPVGGPLFTSSGEILAKPKEPKKPKQTATKVIRIKQPSKSYMMEQGSSIKLVSETPQDLDVPKQRQTGQKHGLRTRSMGDIAERFKMDGSNRRHSSTKVSQWLSWGKTSDTSKTAPSDPVHTTALEKDAPVERRRSTCVSKPSIDFDFLDSHKPKAKPDTAAAKKRSDNIKRGIKSMDASGFCIAQRQSTGSPERIGYRGYYHDASRCKSYIEVEDEVADNSAATTLTPVVSPSSSTKTVPIDAGIPPRVPPHRSPSWHESAFTAKHLSQRSVDSIIINSGPARTATISGAANAPSSCAGSPESITVVQTSPIAAASVVAAAGSDIYTRKCSFSRRKSLSLKRQDSNGNSVYSPGSSASNSPTKAKISPEAEVTEDMKRFMLDGYETTRVLQVVNRDQGSRNSSETSATLKQNEVGKFKDEGLKSETGNVSPQLSEAGDLWANRGNSFLARI